MGSCGASTPPPLLRPDQPQSSVQPAPKLSRVAWIAAGALWLLFTVAAAATSGVGGVLVMVGLTALIAGVVAAVIGRIPTLGLASRRAGLMMAASGLAITMVGVAIAPVATPERTGVTAAVTETPRVAEPKAKKPTPSLVPVASDASVSETTPPKVPPVVKPVAGTALSAKLVYCQRFGDPRPDWQALRQLGSLTTVVPIDPRVEETGAGLGHHRYPGGMTLSDLTDREAVLSAIDEFEVLGRDAFLAKYHFGKARSYFLDYAGTLYDSKAIVGAAHGFQHGRPLSGDNFSGGDATVVPLLERLGFRVKQVDSDEPEGSAWGVGIGDETTRAQISAAYGGSIYGGIEPSQRTPNVMIYTDPTEGVLNGYNFDGWDAHEEGVFSYTGEGRKGHQELTKGNKAILDHAQLGRTIRLFEASDGKKRKGGKLQRYVGAFRVDEARAYRFESAPDAGGQQRKVVVFRLLSEDGQESAQPRRQLATPLHLLGGATFVNSEKSIATEYETTPSTGNVAQRVEGALVWRFEEHLRSEGHVVGRVRIRVPDETHSLVTDTYDRTTGVLYEAKSSSDRATVRLAVGQLLDYLRFIPDAKGALLLPEQPSEDLINFIHSCGFALTFAKGDHWTKRTASITDQT
jgi:hypothetical protein